MTLAGTNEQYGKRLSVEVSGSVHYHTWVAKTQARLAL
jgi:hypothetical protein